jgi:hypothetical protein
MYFYINQENFYKFSALMDTYEGWEEYNDDIDEKYPLRMDSYFATYDKRMNLRNDFYIKNDLGFREVNACNLNANKVINKIETGQLVYSESHATLEILDNYKWNYFRLKLDL